MGKSRVNEYKGALELGRTCASVGALVQRSEGVSALTLGRVCSLTWKWGGGFGAICS